MRCNATHITPAQAGVQKRGGHWIPASAGMTNEETNSCDCFMRLTTYNILDGGQGRQDLIAEVLQAIQPDVVVLQEIYPNGLVERLAGQLGADYFIAESNSSRHVALLSRLPIVTTYSYRPYPPIQHTVLAAQLRHSRHGLLWLLGLHLLPAQGLWREAWRTWEVTAVLQHLGERRDGPCLLVGDLNAAAPADPVREDPAASLRQRLRWQQSRPFLRHALRRLTGAGFIDCYRARHPVAPGYTFPAAAPGVRLDYILASSELAATLVDCTVSDVPPVARASDHRPVTAEFS